MANKLIQVRAKQDTIKEVNELKQLFNSPSFADALRRGISIAYTLIKKVNEENCKIILVSPEGKNTEILIIGK